MLLLFVKQQSSVSETPFAQHKSTICDTSLARWKAPRLLPTCHN